MKRTILLLAAVILLMASCKKGDGLLEEENNNCANPRVYASVSGGDVNLQVDGSSNFGFYEIEYGSNGFSLGSGTTETISGYHTVSSLSNGAYDVYVRGNCGGNSWSDWGSPVSFLIENGNPNLTNPLCTAPRDLKVNGSGALLDKYSFRWQYGSSLDDLSYYELEYGVSGFTLGSGTKVTLNGTRYSDGSFAANKTYDFYVRANCGGDGWSDWSTVKSFYADRNQFACILPTNIMTANTNSTITIDWDDNGEWEWETSFVDGISTVDNGDIKYLNKTSEVTYYHSGWGNYTFYIRAICQDGTKTAWSPAKYINI